MTRLIDADLLRKNMEFICMSIMAGTDPYNAPLTEIDNAPTVEERPHGKWIDRNGNTWCSECRYDTIYLEGDRPLRTDFCPNCGADMRGDEE